MCKEEIKNMKTIKLIKDTKIEHLTLKSTISIDKNAVFIGPNGSGKSTLYSHILEKCDKEKTLKITDEDILNDAFEIKDDTFTIKANISKVNKLEEEIKVIEGGQATITKTGLPSKFEINVYKNDELLHRDHLNIPQSDAVKDIFKDKGNHKKIWKVKKDLEDKKNETIGITFAENKKFINSIYNHLKENESKKCFVCQGDINYDDIINAWNEKVEEFKLKAEIDIPNLSTLEKDEFFNYIVDNPYEEIVAGIACGFDDTKLEELKQNKMYLVKLREQLAEYNDKAKELYKSLSDNSNRQFLTNFFKNYYGLNEAENNITFDDEKYEVHIKLDRSMQNYSSGEKNLLLIYLKIQDFLFSDKTTLIVDDFITSLDYANMCLISCFIDDITSAQNNKCVILFTHNTSFGFALPNKNVDYWWIDRVEDDLLLILFKSKELNQIQEKLKSDDWFAKAFELNLNKITHYDGELDESSDFCGHREKLLNFIKCDYLDYENEINFDKILAFKEKMFLSIRINIEKMIFDVIDMCDNKDMLMEKYNKVRTVYDRLKSVQSDAEFKDIWKNKYSNLPIDYLLKSKISVSNFAKHNEVEKQELDLSIFNPSLNINLNYLKQEQDLFKSILNE
jgi:ABC-type cobalamin/Fe3+-siderophores transport system ATPase subunit